MKKLFFFCLTALLAVSVLAAPTAKKDAWIQQCQKFNVYGIQFGMSPDQVRNVFLKAPRTTLMPWSSTTAYTSQFRFDQDVSFFPLATPMNRILDIGFSPLAPLMATNKLARAQMRVWYDNPYAESYPIQENHYPENDSIEILPYISHKVRFHYRVVITNTTIFMTRPMLKVKDRAEIKTYFNKKEQVVAILVNLMNLRDDEKDSTIKQLNSLYNRNSELSDYDYVTYTIQNAPGVKIQCSWTNDYPWKPTAKDAPPLKTRRWSAENFYYHEEEYLKALDEKQLDDPILDLL